MRRFSGQQSRRGTTAVEAAVVLPVFLAFLFSLIEFGHAQMVNSVLNSACRNGARVGSVEGTSTDQVIAAVNDTIGAAIPIESVDVFVKNAGEFDSSSPPEPTGPTLEGLPDIELADAEPRQMFLIRASVPYNEVAILSMPFMENVVLTGQSFMRHE